MARFVVTITLSNVGDDYDAEKVKSEVESALYDGGFSYGSKVIDCEYEVHVEADD